MNLLTVLVFILCLGSLSCFDYGLVKTTPEISEHCRKQANVGNKDIRDLDDINIKGYYHCVYEKQGTIVNGQYVGKVSACRGIADDNKLDLAVMVIICSLPRP